MSMCTSGRHKMEGEPRCKACRSEREKAKRAALSTAVTPGTPDLLTDMPPVEVLNGAVCAPEVARLFDPVTREEQHKDSYLATVQRVDLAKRICSVCPVRLLCLADALEHRRIGVFGGQYLSPSTHVKRAKAQGSPPITAESFAANTETREEITI